MNLTEKINDQIKTAMKAGEKLRLETLRSLRAGIIEFEKSGAGRDIAPDDEMKILNQAAKRRKDAAEQYTNANRPELAEKELAELKIIQEFLPAQMSEEELTVALTQIIEQTGAKSAAEMGKVMGAAMKTLKGRADGNQIQTIAKQLLAE